MSDRFFRSSFSGSEGTCVEVAHHADAAFIRDSKYSGLARTEPMLAVGPKLWPAFLDLVSSGVSGDIGDQLSVKVFPDGSATLAGAEGITLEYTAAEWEAFVKGVANGEFDR
ncbi:DUF397 domain-containing protein [Nocardia tengchongensis]|uniref:DUF397 domain-containing protein n=1 Tax=Nocardia tengchongensis TaxID=2055889 RepID=A0ABX8CU04_9NOCA|nr:DUF397 domain-containing protein [Nocardia tengchongensis]QVI23391.1 DUF397 domain-containing protein [Nocardia tengchongensis]